MRKNDNFYYAQAVSGQPSAVSRQPSGVSGQPSAVSRQPSAVSCQLLVPSHPEAKLKTQNSKLKRIP